MTEKERNEGGVPDSERVIWLAEALENLCGDVYLLGLGEVTLEQVMRSQGDGLTALKAAGWLHS